MARTLERLSPCAVATLKEPGRHADGGGLYLFVDRGGSKRWLFLFRWQGKLKEMGLGGLTSVGLARRAPRRPRPGSKSRTASIRSPPAGLRG